MSDKFNTGLSQLNVTPILHEAQFRFYNFMKNDLLYKKLL